MPVVKTPNASKSAAKKASTPKSLVKDAKEAPVAKTSQDREKFLKSVSAEMRKARERADMTVSDLHRETGISRTVLQGYEAGRFVPGALELKRLCQVLRVTPNRIIFGDEKPLEQKPLLSSFVGDVSKASGTAKLAVALQVLSSEELAALLSLVESIVISRVGGVKKLQEMFAAIEIMIGGEQTPVLLETFGEEFVEMLTDEQKAKLGMRMDEAFSEKSSKK